MFQLLDETSGNYIALKISGKISSKDYDILIPLLEEAIKKEGELNIFCNMQNFGGMEIKAAWRDFTFGMRNLKKFRRCALIGANNWIQWCVKITNIFLKLEIRLFQLSQEKEAKYWLKE